MKRSSIFIQRQNRQLHVANTCNGEFFELHKLRQYILFVAAVLPTALRYWILRVEIGTETWFQQLGMLC